MEGGSAPSNPRSVEEIFKDYQGRRSALLKALTAEVEDFYKLCDPEKENLCLYGSPDGSWKVNQPADEIPPELPEPVLGINFARDGMDTKEWLSMVAVHSDSWLLAVAFYFGACFDKAERKQLFNLITDIPTLFDIVTEDKSIKEKGSNNPSKRKGTTDLPQPRPSLEEDAEDSLGEEEDEEEHKQAACGSCGKRDSEDEFWICCDLCETWFHGKCVKITPARAEHMKQYKCPSCTSKRQRI